MIMKPIVGLYVLASIASAQSGTFVTTGTGCPSNSPPTLELLTVPSIGQSHTVIAEAWPGDTLIVVLFAGDQQINVPLAVLGAPGCTALIDNVFVSPVMALTVPSATLPILVPNATSLIGSQLQLQAAGLSPSTNALGFAFSNRATLTIGWGKPLPTVAGLKLHFDASNIAGNSINPGDGEPVQMWQDLSGQGNHAVALTSAPIYRRNAINGRPAIDFSQSGTDSLITAASTDFAAPVATMFLVAKSPSTALVSMSIAGTIQHEMLLYARPGFNVRSFHHTSPGQYSELPHQVSSPGAFIQEASFGIATTDVTNVIDGEASTQNLVFTGNPVSFPASVVRAVHVGRRGDTGFENGSGLIAELLVFDRILSSAERDLIGSYLTIKYGLTTSYSGIVP